ncbi:ribbon-helix-helix domain-containing protein [Anthocerotibacter panamensis]|uniref:ribbon-helix-helix domain-containing protein n=1 Tax=Anthocerotibacter panamensis TaxID=2857077 RepID=UPI001C402B7C|nr:ribbon-helix-helix domain-containing protein [Anthocerotibacter panamensis]
MFTAAKTPTTEMEVTSIRLEHDLKEKLKELAKGQGYQALIRDILWDYVRQQKGSSLPGLARADLQASIPSTAEQELRCALTGRVLHAQESILLGLTRTGEIVPLSLESMSPSIIR